MTNPEKQKSAFVTGGTGAVGTALVRELVGRGWQVYALHRATSNVETLRPLGATLIEGDIAERDKIVGKVPPGTDVFFHVAASLSASSRDDDEQMRNNVDGTRNAVEAALQAGVGRFVHTSSISAYGRHKTPISEDTPTIADRSFICYERSKWLAEEEVRAGVRRGLDAVIVNPGAIMGPGFTGAWAVLFYQLRDGQVKALPPGDLEVNHIDEVVKVLISAAEKGRTGENYLLTGDRVAIATVIRKAGALMGIEVKAPVLNAYLLIGLAWIFEKVVLLRGKEPPLTPEFAAIMSQKLKCDTDKARRELGYKHVPWETCLTEMYQWLHERSKI